MASGPENPPIPRSADLLASGDLVEEMYERWKADAASVGEQWQLLFTGFDLASCSTATTAEDQARAQTKIAGLIHAYRCLGHLQARVNPLADPPPAQPELAPEELGFRQSEEDEVFDTDGLAGPERASLREILEILNDTYCGSVGVEYMHIQDREVRSWLQEEMEPSRNQPDLDREAKLEILELLTDAELFETFTGSRYPGQKRFSLEGAESLIPAVHTLVEHAPELGAEEMVIGMAHRGRLNLLANILDKPYERIFHEFEDTLLPDWAGGDGDVKYHRGFSSVHTNRNGKALSLLLAANPSHLEAVGPVVEGRVRAKQRRAGDVERELIIPVLLHGDAAFAGQGLVAENFNLSQLPGYRTGGTVHLIVNNQIGFTTSPEEARSTRYSTDVAKMVDAPIFHVNGDEPEAVVHVTDMALRFRQRFARDVVVDIVCYRRHGHNEGDEPAFTQPVLYHKIRSRPSVRKLYMERLVERGELRQRESDELVEEFRMRLRKAFDSTKTAPPLPPKKFSFEGPWKNLDNPFSFEPADTAVDHSTLVEVATALTSIPAGFKLHRKVARHLPKVAEAVSEHGEIDWSLAERLAFGSLLVENLPVRLSGQDSERGTFSQRHAVWHDLATQEEYVPLNNIRPGQANFCVYNSMLSEAAVLGFDYGYSLAEPEMLVLWEAQFGDFANGAQVIIDQFIGASLAKWRRSSGLVMLLPHGYEGQGPEHSNAYLERYLAACAEDNIQVCNLTTPAQLFHALRRQLKRPFRRPLVIMSPKSLLRHPRAVSPVEELEEGRFREILTDPTPPGRPRRVVLCSGKVFYDLVEEREKRSVDDVAILRVEQLYPLHGDLLRSALEAYGGEPELCWVQEESENRGGWSFMLQQLRRLLSQRPLRYVGRPASASPATGSLRVHRMEQDALVTEALQGE